MHFLKATAFNALLRQVVIVTSNDWNGSPLRWCRGGIYRKGMCQKRGRESLRLRYGREGTDTYSSLLSFDYNFYFSLSTVD